MPAGRIYTVADIAADPHYPARGMLQEIRMDDGSTLAVPGIVPKLSATPGSHRRNAPALGEDTDAVLREIGLSAQQIQALKERGIVSGSTGTPAGLTSTGAASPVLPRNATRTRYRLARNAVKT